MNKTIAILMAAMIAMVGIPSAVATSHEANVVASAENTCITTMGLSAIGGIAFGNVIPSIIPYVGVDDVEISVTGTSVNGGTCIPEVDQNIDIGISGTEWTVENIPSMLSTSTTIASTSLGLSETQIPNILTTILSDILPGTYDDIVFTLTVPNSALAGQNTQTITITTII